MTYRTQRGLQLSDISYVRTHDSDEIIISLKLESIFSFTQIKYDINVTFHFHNRAG